MFLAMGARLGTLSGDEGSFPGQIVHGNKASVGAKLSQSHVVGAVSAECDSEPVRSLGTSRLGLRVFNTVRKQYGIIGRSQIYGGNAPGPMAMRERGQCPHGYERMGSMPPCPHGYERKGSMPPWL